jgi:hypothetical protein
VKAELNPSKLKGIMLGVFSILGVVLLTQGLITYNWFLRVEYDLLFRDAVTYLASGLACFVGAGVMGYLTRDRGGEKRPLLPVLKKGGLSALMLGLVASNIYLYVYYVYDYGPPLMQCHTLAHSARYDYVDPADEVLVKNASVAAALQAIVGNLSATADTVVRIAQLDRQGQDNLTRIAMSIQAIRDYVNLTIAVLLEKNATLAWQALGEVTSPLPRWNRSVPYPILTDLAWHLYHPATISIAGAYKTGSGRLPLGYYPAVLQSATSLIVELAQRTERWSLAWLNK